MKKITLKLIIAIISLVAAFFLYVYFYGIYSDYKFKQEQLNAIEIDISKVGIVTRITLRDVPDGGEAKGKILKEFKDPQVINDFISKLELIKLIDVQTCTCLGDFDINLYNDNKLLLTISSHHGKYLGVKENNSNIEFWYGDLELSPKAKENIKKLYSEIMPNYKGFIN